MEDPPHIMNKTSNRKAKSACDYCRVKKSKCDENKPCSNCIKKGITCSYNPDEVNPPSKMDKAFGQLENKVDLLDQKISKLLNINNIKLELTEVNNFSHSHSDNKNTISPQIKLDRLSNTSSNKILNSSLLFSEDDSLASIVDELLPILNIPSGNPTAESPSCVILPSEIKYNDSLSDFTQDFLNEVFYTDTKDPYFIHLFDNYNDIFDLSPSSTDRSSDMMDISSLIDETEKKLQNESQINLSTVQKTILREESYSIKGKLDTSFISRLSDLDMKPAYAEELLESYLEHIYPFYPIVCEATIGGITDDIAKNGLILNTSSCQYFLLLALGELTLANENHNYWSSESYKTYNQDLSCQIPLNIPPGFEYFWSAISMIEKMKFILPNGFDIIIIQLLVCVYYLKISQLNDLKRTLLEGSEMLFNFLEIEGHKHTDRDILLRLYWVFLHLERALHNSNLLGNSSSLIKIQQKVSIPRGCKSNFPKDADTFYSNCYMQNILLANIDDKAKVMSVSIDKDISFNECLKIFIKFEYELNAWRTLLPFKFQWDDDVSIRSTHIEMDLLKLKYYLGYVTVCQFLILEFEKRFNNVVIDNKTRPYLNQIEILIQKVLSFTIKAQLIFFRQSIVDLDPIVCLHLMNSQFFIYSSISIERYRSKYGNEFIKLRSGFRCSVKKLKCFSLHSCKIDDRLNILTQMMKDK